MADNILFRGSGLVYWDHFLKFKKTTNDRITRFICPGFLNEGLKKSVTLKNEK